MYSPTLNADAASGSEIDLSIAADPNATLMQILRDGTQIYLGGAVSTFADTGLLAASSLRLYRHHQQQHRLRQRHLLGDHRPGAVLRLSRRDARSGRQLLHRRHRHDHRHRSQFRHRQFYGDLHAQRPSRAGDAQRIERQLLGDVSNVGPFQLPTTAPAARSPSPKARPKTSHVYSSRDARPASISGVSGLSPTLGASWSGVVATVTDANPTSTGSNLVANIVWSDGQTAVGTLVSLGGGLFNVTTSRVFTTPGSLSATVTLDETSTDDCNGGGGGGSDPTPPSTTSTGDTDNPAFTVSGGSFSVMEGDNYTGQVGTIDDTGNPSSSPGNFSATFVTAGGTNIPVTVNGSGGTYTVDANNGGPFHMFDNGQGTLTVSETGSASQSAGVAVTVTPVPVSVTGIDFTTAVNQASPNITVATFTGADPAIVGAGNYTATITWGDGNQSAGTVSYANGVYTVQGANAYATAGTYNNVTIAITDQSAASYGGTSSPTTGSCTATVVQVQSLTVADGSGYETPVTESNGGSGQTAYYVMNDDGTGTLNISASVLPNTSAAYAATEYIVNGPSFTQSGPLSNGPASISLPAVADAESANFTVSAGTIINGLFTSSAQITAAPVHKFIADPASPTVAHNGAVTIKVTGLDDAGNKVKIGSCHYKAEDSNGNILPDQFLTFNYADGTTTFTCNNVTLDKGTYKIVFTKRDFDDLTVTLTVN